MVLLYEDRDIVVLEKAPGELSQGAELDPKSLVTQLNQHFQQQGERAEAYPIHRLDQGVGGLMVFAKGKRGAAALSSAVARQQLTKEYLAVVQGRPSPQRGILRDLLWKDSRANKSYVVTRQRKGVRPAALAYQLLQEQEGHSLVQIRLFTGRTHQIRVQFSSRHWPLLGDGKYGARDKGPLALYAVRLCFPHPHSGRLMEFSHFPRELGGIAITGDYPPLDIVPEQAVQ